MDDFEYDPEDPAVQGVLDPILDYLSSVLPPPAYTIVATLLTHSLSLLAAFIRFVYTLTSAQNWDSQKILPPLITLLMAYLALVSFYRTTSWMIRTTFWFVKWGGILAALAAGAGYFMGNAQAGDGGGIGMFNGGGGAGLLSILGSALLGILNEDNPPRSRSSSSSSSSSSTSRKSRPRARAQTKKTKEQERPKAWESWDKHRDWQYGADGDAARANEGVQEAVQKVAGFVQQAMGAGWWETVKSAVEGSGLAGTRGDSEDRADAGGEQARRKGKGKQDAKGRGSSR